MARRSNIFEYQTRLSTWSRNSSNVTRRAEVAEVEGNSGAITVGGVTEGEVPDVASGEEAEEEDHERSGLLTACHELWQTADAIATSRRSILR